MNSKTSKAKKPPVRTDLCDELKLTREIWYSDQAGVQRLFLERLINSGREFEYCDGNIACLDLVGTPALVAHMDTVNDKAMSKALMFDRKSRRLTRRDAILGADDKAGVQIIWDLFDQCNFILTRDEEIGLLGAESLAGMQHIKERLDDYAVPCFLEFDRMNNHHIIGAYNDYCSMDLSDRIAELSGGLYKIDIGVCTDLDQLNRLGVEGVNLSVGYYDQHSKKESLKIDEFYTAKTLAVTLLAGLQDELWRFETATFEDGYGVYADADGYIGWTDVKPERCTICGIELIPEDGAGEEECTMCQYTSAQMRTKHA